MTVEEYLKACPIDLSYIASLMWPKNASAKVYLSKKLNGERPFTEKDKTLAIEALKQIRSEIASIEGFDNE